MVKDLELEIEKLKIEMREKDQESRISQLKVNELKRMLRYSKLKPLKIEDPIDKLTNRRRSIKAQGRGSNKNLS